jgi:8-oxo-dGTP pyrophosphatase MutT (NUDIX family)
LPPQSSGSRVEKPLVSLARLGDNGGTPLDGLPHITPRLLVAWFVMTAAESIVEALFPLDGHPDLEVREELGLDASDFAPIFERFDPALDPLPQLRAFWPTPIQPAGVRSILESLTKKGTPMSEVHIDRELLAAWLTLTTNHGLFRLLFEKPGEHDLMLVLRPDGLAKVGLTEAAFASLVTRFNALDEAQRSFLLGAFRLARNLWESLEAVKANSVVWEDTKVCPCPSEMRDIVAAMKS